MKNQFSPQAIILSIGFRPNIGGLETHLTDLTNELRKRYQLLIITLPPISTRVKAKTVEKEDNLVIWRIPWFGKNLFYKLLKYPILEFFYLTPPLFLGLLVALIKYPSVQVVHVQGLSGVVAAGFLSKLFKKRLIVSIHFVFHFKKNFFGWFSKQMFNLADRVLGVSMPSMDEMKRIGISSDKVGRCAYWIDLNVFKPIDKKIAKKQVRWSENFSILFIGRLIEEKGIKPLLQAIPMLPKQIKVYIIGDGPLKEEIERAAVINHNLHFLGKIDNTLTPVYFNAADVVVAPSYEETLGRVYMEALACDTPVIASDAGGVREVVNEAVGLLIEVNGQAIANAILRLYKDKNLYNKFRKNARAHISKYYSSKNVSSFIKEYGIK